MLIECVSSGAQQQQRERLLPGEMMGPVQIRAGKYLTTKRFSTVLLLFRTSRLSLLLLFLLLRLAAIFSALVPWCQEKSSTLEGDKSRPRPHARRIICEASQG